MTARAERTARRMNAAAAAGRMSGGGAMDVALAQIRAGFDEAAAINDFKCRVERLAGFGPQHPAVRARYRQRAGPFRHLGLDAAIARAERSWRDERKAFQIAAALGRGNRLSLEILRELRLILRLIRFKRMQVEFGAFVAAVCDDDMMEAAE